MPRLRCDKAARETLSATLTPSTARAVNRQRAIERAMLSPRDPMIPLQ